MVVREIKAVEENFLASAIFAAAFLLVSIRHADIADGADSLDFAGFPAQQIKKQLTQHQQQLSMLL